VYVAETFNTGAESSVGGRVSRLVAAAPAGNPELTVTPIGLSCEATLGIDAVNCVIDEELVSCAPGAVGGTCLRDLSIAGNQGGMTWHATKPVRPGG
jgi:hypothetical protein